MTHLEEYNKIINFRKANPLADGQYGEKHHIVPKSICPILKDSPDNIVRLSAQEHFLAHYHLWLAYRDELHEKKWAKKMCYAFHRMKQQLLKCDDVEIMSKLYDEVRIEFSKETTGRIVSNKTKQKLKESHIGQIPWNKGKHHFEKTKLKISEAKKGCKHQNFGKHLSNETRLKISEAKKGHSFSKEHRMKLSLARRGRIPWNKGKHKQ